MISKLSKYLCAIIVVPFLSGEAYAQSLLPRGECALIVASRSTISQARAYTKGISDKRHLQIFKSSNGWYAISIGTLKPSEVEPVMARWKASGKIPKDSLCSSGKRYVAEMSLSAGASVNNSGVVNRGIASGVGIIRSNECVAGFQQFERRGKNRAFAISPDGKACGWSGENRTIGAAIQAAKTSCTNEGFGNCSVFRDYNVAKKAAPKTTSGCVPSKTFFNLCVFVDNPVATGALLLGAGMLLKGIASTDVSGGADTGYLTDNTAPSQPSRKTGNAIASGFQITSHETYRTGHNIVARGHCNKGGSFKVRYYPNQNSSKNHSIDGFWGNSVNNVATKFCS